MYNLLKFIFKVFFMFLPKKHHKLASDIFNEYIPPPSLLEMYRSIGILKWENEQISGEAFVKKDILPKYFPYKSKPIIFDVGANKGEYSSSILNYLPFSKVFAFEPNPKAFLDLQKKKEINTYNVALGNKKGKEKIHVYKDTPNSQHGSLFPNFAKVINSELSKKETFSFDININTIDNFCSENEIFQIDFLKIDVEGYEFSVLQGAKKMLDNNNIKIIQFEFNVSNILSKVFLFDFYNLLEDKYNFYRLDTNRLIPLGEYNSMNEIFKFQNLLTIQKSIDNEKVS